MNLIYTILSFAAVSVNAFSSPLRSTVSPIDTENVQENCVNQQAGGISLNLEELSEKLNGAGRARLCWDCYKIGVDPADFYSSVHTMGEDMKAISKLFPSSRRSSSLGKDALDRLESLYPNHGGKLEAGVATLSHVSTSQDGTTKLLIRLVDGLEVETVIIPWGGRSTLCISSQVGCAQACKFCATGSMGRLRSLTSDEILVQMFFAKKICRLKGDALPEIANVVFMGLGEPSDNADNVVVATKILTTRSLFQLSASKVIVSTVAPTPESFGLFRDAPCVLAWSVHAVDDDLRKRLVPTTKHSMKELRQGLIDTLNAKPLNLRTVMLEVVLLGGVNDQNSHADELAEFSQVILNEVTGCKLVLNLIPYNPIQNSLFEKPSKETCMAFQQRLRQQHGLYAFVRVTRGDDESAACGQLVTTRRKTNQSSQ